MSIRTVLAAALVPLVLWHAPLHAQDNILLILSDDQGVDMVGCYAEGSDLPPTPNIDALAADGVKFRNAWANPVCSPTRATILTGRYSLRTKVGTIVTMLGSELEPSELTIPRMLDIASPHGYSHSAIGKWHLGLPLGPLTHPNDSGFTHFAGSMANFKFPENYTSWTKVVNGQESHSTSYATTESVDDALAWMAAVPEPWFCYLAFNAPHGPFHAPPAHLHTITLPDVEPREEPRPFYKAMVEAMDTEIGRLLASMDPEVRARTTIIFLSDNGTPDKVTVPPFLPEHAKQTVYEGGLKVPLIVSGPGVVSPGRECTAIVNTSDMFATVLELAGVGDLSQHPVLLDSVSIVPYLKFPDQEPLRATIFAEIFVPNGDGPYEALIRAIRDQRYKLIKRGLDHTHDELFDLVEDPFEQRNLLLAEHVATIPGEARLAYGKLRSELDALLASQP